MTAFEMKLRSWRGRQHKRCRTLRPGRGKVQCDQPAKRDSTNDRAFKVAGVEHAVNLIDVVVQSPLTLEGCARRRFVTQRKGNDTMRPSQCVDCRTHVLPAPL